jgi:hypothetical protein
MAETLCGSGSHTIALSCDGGRVDPDGRNGRGAFTAIFTPPWWVDMAAVKNGSIIQVHPRTRLAGVCLPAGARGHAGSGARQALWCVRLFRGDSAAVDGDGELTMGAFGRSLAYDFPRFVR